MVKEGKEQRNLRFSIDRGGTFTDVYAEVLNSEGDPERREVLKLLSEDPGNYPDAPREGIRRVLEKVTGKDHPRDKPVDTSHISSIRMGTTVATNALLERKGERCALVTTQGFRDLLHIGNQSRPHIFDLEISLPDVLYEEVLELDEQVIIPLGSEPNRRNGKHPPSNGKSNKKGENNHSHEQGTLHECLTGETVCVRKAPDLKQLRTHLKQMKQGGIKSLAVVLKHAAIFPDHEQQVGEVAREIGFDQISLSSEVMQMVKMVPRGYTATADAYLTPRIMQYIKDFQSGFDEGLDKVQLSFMQSDGGLSPVSTFSGHKAILSGPAGGYVGYALTTQWEGQSHEKLQMIGFDMGGTSTDVSRYAGSYEHAPQLDINTVAAGGGSRLFYKTGVFHVGPESAGAHPGPVCYRKNGHPAVTDANLVLGRILPEFFPHIFGEDENQPLDAKGAEKALDELASQINKGNEGQKAKSRDEVAMGFIRVANETMARPIRALTQMRGYDVAQHVLACFGGAGGQHACAIARSLGMRTIFVHHYSGILSAVGIGLADVVVEEQEPAAEALQGKASQGLTKKLSQLQEAATKKLKQQGFRDDQIGVERYLNLRYDGTDVAVMTLCPENGNPAKEFEDAYKREYGFVLEDRSIQVDDVRIRATGRGVPLPDPGKITSKPGPLPKPVATNKAYFEDGGRQDTPAYRLSTLKPGHDIKGPAIILDDISTVVLEPGCTAHITPNGDVRIDVKAADGDKDLNADTCDPIQLAIFSHRFMGIAEQMGRVLQRTSISVNIKERLDFSCALFGPDGSLVANAPHLPVHLGAMSEAVRFQVEYWGDKGPGKGEDVGGITPGSMPPNSHLLAEEGAAILSFKIVKDGKFQGDGMTELLMAPAKLKDTIPNMSGTRNLGDNISDLKAQVAANNKGIGLVEQLIHEFTLPVVQAYMKFIQANAEEAVREMLADFSRDQQLPEVGTVTAQDHMDDGTSITLSVTIDRKQRSATFDFEGTGTEVFGNTNAPPAVTYSAIIYSLRCMVESDIPLNQGCLKPITVKIPQGSILSPSKEAAVVGGNVLTSQRVTDVVLKAFTAAAASQGCMNNLTFGDDDMGYYETIAGGAGAGPHWKGRSGVHTHMTNTRITDPEILERRYPVVLHTFNLRPGSGGAGENEGGDGVIREIEFLRPMTVSILSERRAYAPFGLEGGGDAQPGVNLIIRDSGRTVNIGAKSSVVMQAGERLRILTPGGGGFGVAPARGEQKQQGGNSPKRRRTRQATSHNPRTGGSVARYRREQESA
ncbi:hypothetical protein WJX73_000073 [Symbiochloris irregularis]|uniref:5-oxoprolinase n=1 Tax=Symbiochloris irregularis TaxID=706552 RepID=A0AAW1NY74_9CHLO